MRQSALLRICFLREVDPGGHVQDFRNDSQRPDILFVSLYSLFGSVHLYWMDSTTWIWIEIRIEGQNPWKMGIRKEINRNNFISEDHRECKEDIYCTQKSEEQMGHVA